MICSKKRQLKSVIDYYQQLQHQSQACLTVMSILRSVKLTLQDGDRPHPHLKLLRFKWNSGFYTIQSTNILFRN